MKMKEIGPRGAACPWRPLRPATAKLPNRSFTHLVSSQYVNGLHNIFGAEHLHYTAVTIHFVEIFKF